MSVSGFYSNIPPYELPHKTAVRELLVAEKAVRYAFQLLRTDPPSGFSLSTALEDRITEQLEWILENRLINSGEVRGFDTRTFLNVRKAPELTNVDGRHRGKKPDLVFALKREHLPRIRSHDAIFAECKPVNVTTHRIPPKYCNDGLIRFINGDYAWTMQEGLMIAYVRDGLTISQHLATELASSNLHAAMGNPTPPTQVPGSNATEHAQALHVTTHQRDFDWPGTHGKACEIRIYHSWHSCS